MTSEHDLHALKLLQARIDRFAPVDLAVPLDQLSDHDRQVLPPLLRAARLMDGLFLEQVWAGNLAQLLDLAADDSPLGRAERRYFLMNKGPWSRLDHNERFLRAAHVPPKPPQAAFYPGDASRDEIESWFASLPDPERERATGFFSVIRRDGAGRLVASPYSHVYAPTLTLAAAALREAASHAEEASLRRFLDQRAAAFLSNDYYDSDVAWMELDSTIEPTIGPYETYEDEWFGYKAAFEAVIAIRDAHETNRLSAIGGELQALEDALPIDPRYRNPALGSLAPIRVVNAVFTAGDANRGVQTAAFNLPNDERVLREKGAKRVMLKNIQEAKFRMVLHPIAQRVLAPADRARLSFDAFFAHILLHELMHGLGPHAVHGTTTPVRMALKESAAAIEEAKADTSGLWALARLVDKGVFPASIGRTMYVTYLASMFRSMRFGLNEAHGRGVALQLNYFLDHGAVVAHDNGTFSVVDARIRDVVAALTHDLMTVQAEGRYEVAQDWLARMVELPAPVRRALEGLGGIPVDIAAQHEGHEGHEGHEEHEEHEDGKAR